MALITVIKASSEDLDILQKVGKETFYETFAKYNPEEAMQNYLEKSFAIKKLSEELNNPHSQFFIAWEEDIPLGYLKINSGDAQTKLTDENALEIERIYVKSAYQGKKVGQLLYNKALEIAEAMNCPYIWLGVWESNEKAVSFYRKNGFEEFGTHIFTLGNDKQTDLLMRKILH